MFLKDLVHRSALRNRSAGDVEIGGGGSAAQVFEVTNLTIAAGTNWAVPHDLGTPFSVPLASGFIYSLYLELVTGPGDDQLVFRARTPSGWADQTAVIGTDIQNMGADFTSVLSAFDGTDADPQPVTFQFETPGGATTAGITVVRAIAGFLTTL